MATLHMIDFGPLREKCIYCGCEFHGEERTVEQQKQHDLKCPKHPLAALRKACRAVLLFHTAQTWNDEIDREWLELTSQPTCTTTSLCDTVRAALQATEPT